MSTSNMTPSGAIAPTPDPNNYSRTLENRLEAVERAVGITPRKNTYEDDFRNRSGTNRGPAPGVDGNTQTYENPIDRGTNTNNKKMFRNDSSELNETQKPALGTPNDGTESVIPTRKAAPGPTPEAKATGLDSKVTSRAVSPRERHLGGTTTISNVAAKSPRRIELDAGLYSANTAR